MIWLTAVTGPLIALGRTQLCLETYRSSARDLLSLLPWKNRWADHLFTYNTYHRSIHSPPPSSSSVYGIAISAVKSHLARIPNTVSDQRCYSRLGVAIHRRFRYACIVCHFHCLNCFACLSFQHMSLTKGPLLHPLFSARYPWSCATLQRKTALDLRRQHFTALEPRTCFVSLSLSFFFFSIKLNLLNCGRAAWDWLPRDFINL